MKHLLLFLFSFLALQGTAQVPSGYYKQADGKSGYNLKTALCTIITTGHTQVGYDNLWTVYKTTDVRADGYLWDMYSDMTNFSTEKPSGSYTAEGDVANREHSFPKSWWGGSKAIQYSDAMHVVPVDGYVNNRRSNYPYGETSSPTYTSHGGFSKLGPCDRAIGYSGTVFEPNDEYKGDFARIYFYMATRYQNEIASWSSPMLAGNSDSVYTKWALTMLMRWAAQDPVSQKEIDRNNAVYKAQGNRNPFVDFPGLEQYVWGSKRDTPLRIAGYTFPDDDTPGDEPPAAPVFSIEGGSVMQYTTVSITSPDELPLHYTTDGTTWQEADTPLRLSIDEDVTISAFCEQHGLQSDTVVYAFTVVPIEQPNSNVFTLITDVSDLVAGSYYLIVNESKQMALGQASKDVRSNVAVDISENTIILTDDATQQPTVLQLVRSGDFFSFFIPTEQAYLALVSDANSLKTTDDVTEDGAQWTISFSGSTATITNRRYDTRYICYNSSSPRFAAYKSSSRQQPVALYREQQTPTALHALHPNQQNAVEIYRLDGRRVTPTCPLPAGIYIIGGRKVLVK